MKDRNTLFSRLDGIFETRTLSGKTVAIIGLGTGGSLCADELARCAVDRFRLVDFDKLEVHNIARHTCGCSDIGHYKTEAVADRLRDINPECKVETFQVDIVAQPDVLESVVQGADLVLVCTDNNPSRYRINECCLRHKVPAIYAGAYERAFGGQIMRVIPKVTPCYDCVIGGLQKALGNVPTQRKGPIPYSELNNPSEFKAEPGLSIDVHMIALIQAKMALLTLLRGTDSSLEDFPCDFILWGNRKEWIFPEPLYCKFAKTQFREDCPTCLMFKASPQEQDEARTEAARIVEGAVYNPDVFQGGQGDEASR